MHIRETRGVRETFDKGFEITREIEREKGRCRWRKLESTREMRQDMLRRSEMRRGEENYITTLNIYINR